MSVFARNYSFENFLECLDGQVDLSEIDEMASVNLLLRTDLIGSRQVADVQLGLLESALFVSCVAVELQLKERRTAMPSLI